MLLLHGCFLSIAISVVVVVAAAAAAVSMSREGSTWKEMPMDPTRGTGVPNV